MYGKLIDGNLQIAPKHLDTPDYHVYNPSAELYAERGYKPVTFTDEPEAPTGYYYESGWEETETEIVQTWALVELPDEVDDAEAFSIIFGGEE